MAHAATLIILLPLAGFLVLVLIARYLSERRVGALATSAVGLSFVCSS